MGIKKKRNILCDFCDYSEFLLYFGGHIIIILLSLLNYNCEFGIFSILSNISAISCSFISSISPSLLSFEVCCIFKISDINPICCLICCCIFLFCSSILFCKSNTIPILSIRD
eukprot:550968_1